MSFSLETPVYSSLDNSATAPKPWRIIFIGLFAFAALSVAIVIGVMFTQPKSSNLSQVLVMSDIHLDLGMDSYGVC